jgi:hypothetical protein
MYGVRGLWMRVPISRAEVNQRVRCTDIVLAAQYSSNSLLRRSSPSNLAFYHYFPFAPPSPVPAPLLLLPNPPASTLLLPHPRTARLSDPSPHVNFPPYNTSQLQNPPKMSEASAGTGHETSTQRLTALQQYAVQYKTIIAASIGASAGAVVGYLHHPIFVTC